MLARHRDDDGVDRLVHACRADNDMSVRIAAGAPAEEATAASHWSCAACAATNAISDQNCTHCSPSRRPGHHLSDEELT
jgi:hypothetical protein